MAILETLAGVMKALAVGDRVKVTLRPETGQFPNPVAGQIIQKDADGKILLKSEQSVIEINPADILSITSLQR
jgi:hypothetical protein